ncbi:MAG TPA: ATP-binding protein [Polyangiales bacterium]|nr:ATP-binding protein [Polyangiales bacterium]
MIYPWTAVVGQDALKRALTLTAIDPSIGGVLVQGPRGVAKTTLARALAELVPGQFVELPLGASEERVTGSLDLGAALQGAEVRFQPGLLARAHDGVLYVDEVNLLPDALIDLLLDAAASGRNVVERDGISHTHAARFVLVGTMNPEEGELRPQLTDRFGLSVDAEGRIEPAERAVIITRRLSFDADAAAFRTTYDAAQATLKARITRARELLPRIALESALQAITERCHAANVEGVRADLAMLRAARAHAALHERTSITDEDIEAVAELALRHRRRTPPRGGSPSGGSAPPRGPSQGNTPDGQAFGALEAVPVRAMPAPRLPLWLTAPTGSAEPRRRGRGRTRASRGARAALDRIGSVDWFATLSRTPRVLVLRARRAPPRALWVLALDCSASMLRHDALAHAKGVARAFAAQAHRAGAQVTVLSFGADRTALASSARDHRTTRDEALDALPAGGNTPLAAALREAYALCREDEDRHHRIILLTDGRTREHVEAPGDVDLTVIDCERTPVKLGRARTLATTLHAHYLHVDNLRGATSSR